MKTSAKFDTYIHELFKNNSNNTNRRTIIDTAKAYHCNVDLKSEFRFDIIQYGRLKCFLKVMKEYLTLEPCDLECIEVYKLLSTYLKSTL